MGIKGFEDEVKKSDEEIEAQKCIEQHKLEYRKYMKELQGTKGEIETIQKTLEATRERMQKDFEKWLYVMMKEKGLAGASQLNDNISKTDAGTNSLRPPGPVHPGKMGVPQVLTLGDSFSNSGQTVNGNSKVAKDIQAFYKARDEVYDNSSRGDY